MSAIPISTSGIYPRSLQQAFPNTVQYGAAISVPYKIKNKGKIKTIALCAVLLTVFWPLFL